RRLAQPAILIRPAPALAALVTRVELDLQHQALFLLHLGPRPVTQRLELHEVVPFGSRALARPRPIVPAGRAIQMHLGRGTSGRYTFSMPAMSTAKMTAAQFFELGEDPPGVRLELVDGEIEVSPSPVPRHSYTEKALARLLGNHIE